MQRVIFSFFNASLAHPSALSLETAKRFHERLNIVFVGAPFARYTKLMIDTGNPFDRLDEFWSVLDSFYEESVIPQLELGKNIVTDGNALTAFVAVASSVAKEEYEKLSAFHFDRVRERQTRRGIAQPIYLIEDSGRDFEVARLENTARCAGWDSVAIESYVDRQRTIRRDYFDETRKDQLMPYRLDLTQLRSLDAQCRRAADIIFGRGFAAKAEDGVAA